MQDELYNLIKKYESKGDFTYAEVTDEMLTGAEERLSVIIPEEYKYFLKKYGHGGIGGIEVFGVGKNGVLIFEKETLKYREYGLPNELIVIENCDEWIYCLDTTNGKVVMWSRGKNEYKEVFEGFNIFLLDRTTDILENL